MTYSRQSLQFWAHQGGETVPDLSSAIPDRDLNEHSDVLQHGDARTAMKCGTNIPQEPLLKHVGSVDWASTELVVFHPEFETQPAYLDSKSSIVEPQSPFSEYIDGSTNSDSTTSSGSASKRSSATSFNYDDPDTDVGSPERAAIPTILLNGHAIDVAEDIYKAISRDRDGLLKANGLLHPESAIISRQPKIPRQEPPQQFSLPERTQISTLNEFEVIPLGAEIRKEILFQSPLFPSLVPILHKWRLLSFYGDFFPADKRVMLLSEMGKCTTTLRSSIGSVAWLQSWALYETEQIQSTKASLLSRTVTFVCSSFKGGSSVPPSSITSVIKHSTDAHISPYLLTQAIEAYVRSVQPDRRNLTATHLAETKDFSRLARIMLEDLEMLTKPSLTKPISKSNATAIISCRDYVDDICPALIRTIKLCRARYFEALEYTSRRCECGCKAGLATTCISNAAQTSSNVKNSRTTNNRSLLSSFKLSNIALLPRNTNAKTTRRIHYSLSQREQAELDGTRTLLMEMRLAGHLTRSKASQNTREKENGGSEDDTKTK